MPVSKRQRLRGETDLNNQQADKQKAKAMLLEFKEAKKTIKAKWTQKVKEIIINEERKQLKEAKLKLKPNSRLFIMLKVNRQESWP